MSEHDQVKYPLAFDGRWVLRYHVPYSVEHEGGAHLVVASIFAEPRVHARIRISCGGRHVAEYDDLTPGDPVEITGDTWRVTAVDYRTRVELERVDGVDGTGRTGGRESDDDQEVNGVQGDRSA
ncbi:DUF6406 domain-containing protein [Streptomyces sp. NPDC048664]|uniref:DUF6406 domain-containing protein n=1 Tax=Streptomyces sp. NPDC048664 TaxID=3154505 RepID=UPI0034389518